MTLFLELHTCLVLKISEIKCSIVTRNDPKIKLESIKSMKKGSSLQAFLIHYMLLLIDRPLIMTEVRDTFQLIDNQLV